MRRHLAAVLGATLAACTDGPLTDDGLWAVNGARSGVFERLSSFVTCTLVSSPTAGTGIAFDVSFDKHPDVSSLHFLFTPFPDQRTGQRELRVGGLGFMVPVGAQVGPTFVGRMEGSLGKLVPHKRVQETAHEFFLHHVVLPEQTFRTPDGRDFTLAGRLSDVRLYCRDAR